MRKMTRTTADGRGSALVPRALVATLVCIVAASLLVACSSRRAMSSSTESDFTPLFDGQTLAQWRGDPMYWSVEGGAITGRSTGDVPANTFLIHERHFRDFELRFKARLRVPGNSGMNFRSRLHTAHEFSVRGYHANVVTVPPSRMERYANLPIRRVGRSWGRRGSRPR